MSNNQTILEYLRTVLWTLFGVFVIIIIIMAVAQVDVYKEQERISMQDDAIEYYLVGVLIEKNKYLEQKYPKNYRINLKLGILYEIKKDYKSAEQNYYMAVSKAPYEEFYPKYKLACFLIKEDKLEEAQSIADETLDSPNKIMIAYKAEIFYKLAEKYYNMGDYGNAIVRYEKALSYYKFVKSPSVKMVENSNASAYVYLAEDYLKEGQFEEAVNALTIANSIVDAPILKYKLGLILAPKDPQVAYKYFDEVFKKEPSIINYDEYIKFLYVLSINALADGNVSLSELYKYKAKRVEDYYQSNVLSIKDLSIEYADGGIYLKKFRKKYIMEIEFNLKNASQQDLKTLFLDVTFKDDGQVVSTYNAQVVTPDEPLKAGTFSPVIYIKTEKPQTEADAKNKKIDVEITASKTVDSYKLKIGDIGIKELNSPKKRKFDFGLWVKKIKKYLRGFVHQR